MPSSDNLDMDDCDCLLPSSPRTTSPGYQDQQSIADDISDQPQPATTDVGIHHRPMPEHIINTDGDDESVCEANTETFTNQGEKSLYIMMPSITSGRFWRYITKPQPL